MELNKAYGHELSFDTNLSYYDQPVKGKWIYHYWDKTKYTSESIDAFYFIEDFHQQPIPEVYARMIQYSDCMVDTSTQVFYEKAQRSDIRYANNQSANKVQQLIDYVQKATHRPEYNGAYNTKAYDTYWEQYRLWDSLRLYRVDSLQQHDEKFGKLFNEAVAEALSNGNTGDEFEEYVGRYYSKKAELDLKRNRIVVGNCSQDNSPRIHALNIAKLSAETVNWEIFLRSHLDIVNDRFERASDGSYAWGRRKTYIKELEVLDIDVLDLMLGISLRVENPSRNHYYGSLGRLGRALSETGKQDEIESKMLQMIGDRQLDDLNRILIYYLFLNYNYNLDNKERQVLNKEKLAAAVKTLPAYLASKIVVD